LIGSTKTVGGIHSKDYGMFS